MESRGVCNERDADGFPTNCGGNREPGCVLTAHVLSGKANLVGAPVPGTCTALDADRYPVTCGDRLEPACARATRVALATVGIHIGACKSGHAEAFGTGYLKDAEGYPEVCGANGERPCELDVQIAQGGSPPASWGSSSTRTRSRPSRVIIAGRPRGLARRRGAPAASGPSSTSTA